MNRTKRTAIIGGGASGLICAIFCAKSGVHVDIFEQNQKCAKKILASGNGRCNITNTNLTCNDYFSQNPYFAEFALKQFGFREFEKFCEGIGLLLDVKDDGRVYPLSNEAKSVASLLTTQAKSLGVNFHTDTKITDIKKLLREYDAVIVATGSEAASHLGGNSDGLEFAKEFGHNIIPTYPSLVQLHLDSKTVKKMSGAKIEGEVSLLINNQKELTCSGDILFTDYGASGFAVLDISQSASAALMENQHVSISVNLLPSFNAQKLASHINKTAQSSSGFTIADILTGLLPIKIVNALLDELNIPAALDAKSIDMKLAKKTALKILGWRFEVSGTHGFRHAEVAGGGVDTAEIDPENFESLKQKGLYFCGEVSDPQEFKGSLSSALDMAVEELNPLLNIHTGPKIDQNKLKLMASRLALPIGLALNRSKDMNFLKIKEKGPKLKGADIVKSFRIPNMAIIGCLVLIMGFVAWMNIRLNSSINNVKKELDIKTLRLRQFTKFQERKAAYEDIKLKKVDVRTVLGQIAKLLPKDTSVITMVFSSQKRLVTIYGEALSPDSVSEFMNSLDSAAEFQRIKLNEIKRVGKFNTFSLEFNVR